jgi:phosphocarrier protein
MREVRFKISNEYGLHARLATELVKVANEFNSQIQLVCKDMETNFKSIMGVMALGVSSGEVITIRAKGFDENEAISALSLKIIELNIGKEA